MFLVVVVKGRFLAIARPPSPHWLPYQACTFNSEILVYSRDALAGNIIDPATLLYCWTMILCWTVFQGTKTLQWHLYTCKWLYAKVPDRKGTYYGLQHRVSVYHAYSYGYHTTYEVRSLLSWCCASQAYMACASRAGAQSPREKVSFYDINKQKVGQLNLFVYEST